MKKEFTVLLVEDNEGDVRIIIELLKEQSSLSFSITHVSNLVDAIKSISKFKYDAILLDLGLPDSTGIETFLSLNNSFPDLATTIILTGLNDVEIGLIAVNKGAQDYIIKGTIDSEKLSKSIIYAYERSHLNHELKLQIEARKLAEDEIGFNLKRLKILVDILQYQSGTIQEYLDYALSKAIELTESKIGYIYYYNEKKEEFILNSWSQDVMKKCTIAEQQTIYELSKTGVWGEAVRQRKPILINDFQASHPLKKGYPDGHMPLFKYLTIPVFNNHEIVGVVAVANKETDYTETDTLQLSLLMDVVWEVAERKKADAEILMLNAELEARVLERTAQLETLNIELDSFSHSVSHDLRAPLRHISGFAEIIENDFSEKHHLDTIIGSAKKMGILIDDLLNLSRTNRTELKKTSINMKQIVDEAYASFEDSITNRNIELIITALPEVNGDYNLLRLVWINLLDNAIKYTKTRNTAIIRVTGREEAEEYIFCISDNGVGFDMQYAQKLFGAFQRLHSELQFEGTGIGLATVRRIITRHGGKIWAEAELDKGAVFCFSLPK
jgi:signal transduction histidine kinase/DNA-binding NarL/FixJ family response regulator